MKNKLEIQAVMKADGAVSLEMITAYLNGLEAKVVTLGLLDNMANAFTKNPLEKAEFLKSVHDAMEELIIKILLDA